jgi:methylenetetrahydrofolate reductase (NADPH)
VLEHASKAAMFACKDCGDCSLPDIAFLCPESQCAKNQRNGPCGGTRDGKCEVAEFECIWGRAYDRMKYEGCEQNMLAHAPVIQDQSLRGTSSWANALLGRDHTAHRPTPSLSCNNPASAGVVTSVTMSSSERKESHVGNTDPQTRSDATVRDPAPVQADR